MNEASELYLEHRRLIQAVQRDRKLEKASVVVFLSRLSEADTRIKDCFQRSVLRRVALFWGDILDRMIKEEG